LIKEVVANERKGIYISRSWPGSTNIQRPSIRSSNRHYLKNTQTHILRSYNTILNHTLHPQNHTHHTPTMSSNSNSNSNSHSRSQPQQSQRRTSLSSIDADSIYQQKASAQSSQSQSKPSLLTKAKNALARNKSPEAEAENQKRRDEYERLGMSDKVVNGLGGMRMNA
jgi:hypothetical protein